MKKCSRCGEEKEESRFNRRSKAKDGLSVWCKSCFASYDRGRYRTVDKERKDRNRNRSVRRNQDNLWKIMTASKCIQCGETDPMVFEFDHRDPSTKRYSISEMMTMSWSSIEDELAKCDILCCNCHRRKTIRQLGWWRQERQDS